MTPVGVPTRIHGEAGLIPLPSEGIRLTVRPQANWRRRFVFAAA
jgi:hypothetical protein